MNEHYIQTAAILSTVILTAIAVFQLLLFAGLPLGEYSWGGKHTGVLPRKMRMMSLPSAFLLLAMGFVFLIHTKVLVLGSAIPTHILVWNITVFLGFNTLGNLASRSKKEKMVMAPLAGIAFASCLLVSIFSR